ncbi:hypothetical protein [Pseudomonas guariconensis]|uniref:hypothetical protein n=1 Tax=Pseudomonas guariconensis TaxID=1288410 RepID=UPI003905F256
MLTKIKDSLNRPPRVPTRGVLLGLLGLQIFLLTTALLVVTVWPEKAFAIAPQILMSLGLSVPIVLTVIKYRVVE